MKRLLTAFALALVVLTACSTNGWTALSRRDFVGACVDGGLGSVDFCKCWQREIEDSGMSPDEFGDPDETTTAAMVACRDLL